MFSEPAGTSPCWTWNCHMIPCGISELSWLSSWLVCLSPAFPRSLCFPLHLHLLLVPLPILLLQPLFSPPTSDLIVHIQEVSSIFSCIPGQARTLTRRRQCDPRLHPTEQAAGPPQSMVGDGLGWLWFHGRGCRTLGAAPVPFLDLFIPCIPAVPDEMHGVALGIPGGSVLACFSPPCFSTCCSAAPTDISSVVPSETSPAHATNRTGEGQPRFPEMLGHLQGLCHLVSPALLLVRRSPQSPPG